MLIFPAVDLVGGKAVRLFQGRYDKMTVYSDDPVAVALDFKAKGASHVHLVDLEGARDGGTPNFETVCRIKEASGLFCEAGGGVRDMRVIDRYLAAGIDRVILGTAAVTDAAFLRQAVEAYGERVAVGVDLKDGFIAVKGWTENHPMPAAAFFERLEALGVQNVICTDISRDGAMRGANLSLYRELYAAYKAIRFTASGGVSSMEDVRRLKEMGLYAAIIGKAYYTGAIDLGEAVKLAEC